MKINDNIDLLEERHSVRDFIFVISSSCGVDLGFFEKAHRVFENEEFGQEIMELRLKKETAKKLALKILENV